MNSFQLAFCQNQATGVSIASVRKYHRIFRQLKAVTKSHTMSTECCSRSGER